MMEKNYKRAWRRKKKLTKWEKRLKNELRYYPYTMKDKTWQDMKEHRRFHIYKTLGKICNCYFCQGPYYNRRWYKFDTNRIIREELYDDIAHQTPRSSSYKIVTD